MVKKYHLKVVVQTPVGEVRGYITKPDTPDTKEEIIKGRDELEQKLHLCSYLVINGDGGVEHLLHNPLIVNSVFTFSIVAAQEGLLT